MPDISDKVQTKEPVWDCEAWTPPPRVFQLSSATNSNRLLQKTLQLPVPSCTTLLSVVFCVSLSFYSGFIWCEALMHISNSFLSKLDIDQAPEVMRLVRLEAIDSGAANDARANVWARLASDIEPVP